MKKQMRLFFFLIGLIGITILVLTTDISAIDWSIFISKEFFILLSILLALWFVIYIIHTIVYRIILGEKRDSIKFINLFGICISGFALNNVTPAGVLGGEPYRIIELQRYVKTEKAASTAFTFTIVYMTGHFLLWATEAVFYYILKCPGELFSTIAITIVGLLALFCSSLVIFGNKYNIINSIVRFLSHLPLIGKKISSFYESKKEKLSEIDNEIEAFRKQQKKLVCALSLEYISRIFESLEYYLIINFLGIKISLLAAIVIMSNASLMGNLLFFIPLQMGSRESGMSIALSWFTENTSVIIPACIIYRMRDIICTFIGVLCILLNKRKQQ